MRWQEITKLMELQKFIPEFKERIATWKGRRNSVLVLLFVIWSFFGMVVSLVDKPTQPWWLLPGLLALYALATLGFWLVLLKRLKGTRVHLWVKTYITPETWYVAVALPFLLFVLPLLIFSIFR